MVGTLGIAASGIFDGNSLVALGLGVIAIFFLLTGLRRRQRQRSQMAPRTTVLRSPPAVSAGTQERLRRDLEDLIGELQELSRKISAEIDTRFAKLEAAMRDADRRIAVLNRLSRGESDTNGSSAAATETHDARYTVVYELADAGHSPVEIARDLGKTPGEIELILNLRKSVQR